ncbi:hypothetical protein FQN58_24775 [Bacteroides xylanisolvens]|uniref:hypothetical protein n=1 Tax=Bacteroides xylanisolvens TaxID=371601 RepID=UPI001BAB8FC9|nr:hypothetical protein [Bacteroides xylanisolvens]QUR46169.1 hypothetical protein FQN58_24775 [Bacteroides xylanisolvens]
MAILSNGKFYGFLCSVKATGQKLANGVKEYVEDFVSGFAGHGWKIWEYMAGKWKLEIDTIVVRETMLVFEMLISKVRAIIGAQTISQGHGKVKSARISGTEYLIELEDEDMSIVAHDFVRCQTFTGNTTKLYHVEISSVDIETKTLHVPLSEFEKDESGNILYPPMPGDELVQFGNSQNKARQSAIYMHADETGQPAIDVMFDIDSKDWTDKVKVRMGGDIPGGNGLKGFYCVNGMIKCVDDKGMVIYEFAPNGAVNIGKGNIIYNPSTNKVTLGSGVTLTWNNLDDESKENLKGNPGNDGNSVYITYHDSEEEPECPTGDGTRNGWHTNSTASVVWISQKVAESADSGEWGKPINIKGEPGKDGQDANLLPWVEEWNNNKTQIGDEYIISLKMFTGTNTGTPANPILTGVAIGRGVITINGVEKTGLFGLKDGKLTFEIDAETGDAVFRGKIETRTSGSRIVIDPVTNSFEMYNMNDMLVFSLSFEGDASSAYPKFLIQGTEFAEYYPYISMTGKSMNAKMYCSEKGSSADVTWGISESGIYHKKNNQGFSLNVDLAQTNIPIVGGSQSLHLTRFYPGFLPGYSAAKTGEVYVTSDGTLKIKGYSVES